MLKAVRSYEEACRVFRWRIPDRYNLAFDVCDRQTMAGADGHRTALVVDAEDGNVDRYTFHMLRLLSNRLVNVLAGAGVKPGDRVALALPAGVEAAIGLLAILKMGAIVVPIAEGLGAEPLAWRLADSGAKAVVVSSAHIAALTLVRSGLPDLLLALAVGEAGFGVAELWAELEAASDSCAPAVTAADDAAFIFYPADACGSPKGVLHAHRAMTGNLPAVGLALEFFPQFGDVMWTSADWMSAEALFRAVLPAWHHGIPVIARPGPFDAVQALEVMARHGIRTAYLPPDHLAWLTEAASTRPHPMPRALMSGPDPLSRGLRERVRKVFGIDANEAWGVAECGAVVANLSTLMECRPGSPGRAAPGVTVEAVDEHGRILSAGRRGMLAVSPRAPGNCLGRWGETAKPQAGGAWLPTGRLGSRDLDGYVWPEPLALEDGIVLVEGLRVRLTEVEAALAAHPDVAAAAVVAMGDGDLKGFVVSMGRAGDAAFVRDLQDWVATRRAQHEVPRRMEFLDSLPAADGTVLRDELANRPLRLDAPAAEDRLSGPWK
jgi:acetyl-CoA synthetase